MENPNDISELKYGRDTFCAKAETSRFDPNCDGEIFYKSLTVIKGRITREVVMGERGSGRSIPFLIFHLVCVTAWHVGVVDTLICGKRSRFTNHLCVIFASFITNKLHSNGNLNVRKQYQTFKIIAEVSVSQIHHDKSWLQHSSLCLFGITKSDIT